MQDAIMWQIDTWQQIRYKFRWKRLYSVVCDNIWFETVFTALWRSACEGRCERPAIKFWCQISFYKKLSVHLYLKTRQCGCRLHGPLQLSPFHTKKRLEWTFVSLILPWKVLNLTLSICVELHPFNNNLTGIWHHTWTVCMFWVTHEPSTLYSTYAVGVFRGCWRQERMGSTE